MVSMNQIRTLTIKSEGFDKAKRDLDGLSASSEKLASSARTMQTSIMATSKQVDALERSLDPGVKALSQYERGVALLDRALAQGRISTERYDRTFSLLEQRYQMAQRAANQHAVALAGHSNAVALNRDQIQQLSFQLNDMVTMLASGSSPFQVLATQGGQVFQIFQQGQGGIGGQIRALGGAIGGLLTPARVALGGIAGLAVAGIAAWNSYDNKLKDVQRSLNGLGAGAGATSLRIFDAARGAAGNSAISFGQAVSGGAQFAGAGITPELYQPLNEAAMRFSRGFGGTVDEAQKRFAEMFADPAKGVEELTKTFGPFGVEVTRNIQRLQAQGQLEEAQVALYGLLNDRLKGVVDTSGYIERAWGAIRAAGSNVAGRVGAIGQPLTPREEYRVAYQNEQMATKFGNSEGAAEFRQKRIAAEAKLNAEELASEQARANAIRIRMEWLQDANKRITDLANVGAQAITARTAAERLAVEQERIRREAIYDTSRTNTVAAESERARTLAIAEANKALRDYRRSSADEAFLGGARTPLEEFRRRSQLEMRDLNERTNVLPPNEQWRSQIKMGEDSRAGNLWNPSPTSPFGPLGVYGVLPSGSFSQNLTKREMQGLEAIAASPRFRELTVSPSKPVGSSDAPGPVDDSRVANWIKNRTEQLFFDTGREIEANSRMLKVNADTFGKSTYEVARATEAVRLENEIKRLGITDTSQYAEAIRRLSEQEGQLAAAREKNAERQRQVIETLDLARSGMSDALSSPLKAMIRGESPTKALQQSGMRLIDRSIDMVSNNLVKSLMGGMGKPGEGILGDLLGGLLGVGQRQTAMMNVNASVVNIGGAGTFGGISGLFGGFGTNSSGWDNSAELAASNAGDMWIMSAKGNVFSAGNLVPFANGGVVGAPTMFPMRGGSTGLMGEAGPEAIMPLRRGADGKLGVAAAGQNGGKVNVQVVNQSGTPMNATAEETRGQDGSRNIKIMMQQMIVDTMANGPGRSLLEKQYGLRRLGK